MTSAGSPWRGCVVSLLQFLVVLQALLSPAAATATERDHAWADRLGIICIASQGQPARAREPVHEHQAAWCDLACQTMAAAGLLAPPPQAFLQPPKPAFVAPITFVRATLPPEPAHRLTAFPARAPPAFV